MAMQVLPGQILCSSVQGAPADASMSPPHLRAVFRPIALLLYRLFGWKVIDHRPKPMGSCIYVVAPHTSNWDFLIGVGARSIGRLGNTKYLAKKQLFAWPIGWFFRALGGYPVDRSKNTNITDQVVNYFKTIPGFSIGITPEGTRKAVKSWKTGFWRIAQQANVPLILTSFDYARKEVTFREPFWVTDDMEKDIAWMVDHFKQFAGKNRPTA
jgi:1-acyl-sn-glycerol-3-phosphate acyltransferase